MVNYVLPTSVKIEICYGLYVVGVEGHLEWWLKSLLKLSPVSLLWELFIISLLLMMQFIKNWYDINNPFF